MTTQRWQVADYRSRRHLLDPDVFLNGSNPPPTDIIEPEVWDYLMHLADHVSITTSNHHGALLRRLFDLERVWVDAIAEKPSFLDTAMVDVMDDFTASMFLLLHGYYRQSIAALRSVLETTAIGVYLELLNDKVEFGRWRRGIKEIGFGHAADRLRALPVVSAFEMRLRAAVQDDPFAQRSPDSEGGWSRRLYGRLCEYTHSRPGRTNSDLWRSNGPIYVRRHVNLVGSLYSETFTLSMLLLRFARPGQTGPRGFERNYSASARAHMLFVPLNCVSITSGFPWTSVGAMMAHWVSGPDQRQLSAHLAHCSAVRRRSAIRTRSRHSLCAGGLSVMG